MSVREARCDISLCHLSSFDQMRIDRKFGPLRVAHTTYPLKIGITDGCTHDSPCCCEGRQCHTDVYM